MNVLLWISYFVMLSLYAYAFGSYGSSFFPSEYQVLARHLFASGAVIIFTTINALGAAVTGKAEEFIVGLKLLILLVFIGAGISTIHASKIEPSTWPATVPLIAGGMIIFVAYEGFELIANTAKDVREPKKNLPRAYYTAVCFVIVLYILIAMITVGGDLTLSQIAKSSDYALAEAAKPFLGHAGFIMIGIAAMLSTSSAINATLYGSSRISYIIAKDGELPAVLEKKVWKKPIEGLLITSAVTLLVVNLFNISSIATMGSAGFLVIFSAVNAACALKHEKANSNRWFSWFGCAVTLVALGALLWQTGRTEPYQILVLVVMAGLAFIIEFIYRKVTGRSLHSCIRSRDA